MEEDQTQNVRRKKRRKRRLQGAVLYIAIAIGLAWFFESQATTTIIFVRHAEKDLSVKDDPELTEDGQRRAFELTRQMKDADVVAGIDAIYSTPFKRNVATVEPLSKLLELPINLYDKNDYESVLETILDNHKGKIILVVGHSDTLANLMAELGASKSVPTIADNEYDNIYIVSIPWFGKTKTIRLRYGAPYDPDGKVRAIK
ncbi:MAG: histidine phosphatase family protein [Woeseiaceae bacterium]|jgi:broad specificity phosphatase PhoE|nr:histidine phosphatase family protein [Woeseiaceae bacterium]MDG1865352.1 histidine phosphatase family protein [Woeseiaceae bacterium]